MSEIHKETDAILQEITDISENRKRELEDVLGDKAEVFLPKLRSIKHFQYKLGLEEHKPFRVTPYNIPLSYRYQVCKEMSDVRR